MSNEALQASLTEGLGIECGPYTAWDPVNAVMIRHWCEALGDDNPIYRGVDATALAPPAMLQVWTMRDAHGQHAPGSAQEDPFALLGVLEKAGYPAVVAVNCDQEYHRYLEDGEKVYHRASIESVSEEKTTALGKGFFITQLSEYFDESDNCVGTMRFRLFKYAPHAQQVDVAGHADQGLQKPKRMRPVRNHDTGFFWEGVDNGKLLIQHCQGCDTLRHPPSPMCPSCQSLDWDTRTASGRGEVHSFTVMHHPAIPPFEYPNIVALVELEESTRLITQLTGIRRQDVRIGMAVEVVFEEVEEGLVLPLFRPVQEQPS